MESLTAWSITNSRFSSINVPSSSSISAKKNRYYQRRFRVSASSPREGYELDKWDHMELKFGKLLGEDPKLTLYKIMAKKANPDVSHLEVEKEFHKKKGKIDESLLKIAINLEAERQFSDVPTDKNMKLSRPVMSKGVKGQTTADLNLSRPIFNKGIKPTFDLNLSRPSLNKGIISTQPIEKNQSLSDSEKDTTPNVSLRKPAVVREDDLETGKRSKLNIKPNLVLKMRKDKVEDLSDLSLLKKPEALQKPSVRDVEDKPLDKPVESMSSEDLQDKPKMNDLANSKEFSDGIKQRDAILIDGEYSSILVNEKSAADNNDMFPQASLLGRPQRVVTFVKETLQPIEKDAFNVNEGASEFHIDEQVTVSAEQEEREEIDWRRAEHLLQTGERAEVELVSCSSRGFIVSFGSLAGFLPYRNLGAKWKFIAFESWLRQKGLDPSLYRQNMSILGSSDKSTVIEQTLTSSIKFEDLLEEYDKEKTMFLSSFIGQKTKASVLLVERNSRRLVFSGRPEEKEEVVEKKKSVMAKLSVGDVVNCCVTKIAYFGIFVEVEGVPALIHQTEISWDATLDPSAYYKIGQIIEAKVHQLDFALGRISLSLKEMKPDPLMEALESVVGDHTSLGGSLEATQADIEPWEDVESLIGELQNVGGIQNVSKGRFFISPGLAPTFQIYMGSVFDNQYKLLARYGNKVQEVIVQTYMDKEEMKSAILTCTNRVQ